MSIRQTGGVDEYRTAKGIRFEIRYLAGAEDLAELIPAIGDPAPWAGENTYITKITKTFSGCGVWSVRLTAEYLEDVSDLPSLGININGMEEIAEQSFDVTGIYFPPEWFGCRIAGPEDCTPFTCQSSELLPDGKIKYRNIDGDWARPGDFIAVNAQPLFYIPDTDTKAQDALTGTRTYSRSPFTGTIPDEWIGQTVSTRIYRCIFYVRKNITNISGFTGISGLFGNGCTPDRTGTGVWKAVSQRIRTVSGSDGKSYTRIDRTMIEAPGSLTWAEEKNGGIWRW